MLDGETLGLVYLELKDCVLRSEFATEVDWQEELVLDDATETDFLREAAWVILTSGFRESVVRRHFAAVSRAFLFWRCAADIACQYDRCRRDAMAVFSNARKIDAIARIADYVAHHGFTAVKARIEEQDVRFLGELPYIGSVTAYHLAKNLGIDVVKPDRHLVRMARTAGYETPESMCRAVAAVVGDRLATIDTVLWRYATLDRDYALRFEGSECSVPAQSVAV